MNTKISSFVLVVSFLAFQGCKDDEETATITPVAKTKTELISVSPWILSASTVNPGFDDGEGNLITDLFSMNEPCDNDDEIIFMADGTGSENEGATKCDPDGEQELGTFAWSFNATETEIRAFGDTLGISELSETKMILTTILTEDGLSNTITVTFEH
jgi:hypothetical protein